MKAVAHRVADEKLLQLLRQFLDAGYMEKWQYHKTYSGTPQGGVRSPLLANIFLHQLDEDLIKALRANETQSKRASNARRNPESRRIENKITRTRRKLRQIIGAEREPIIKTLKELERPLGLTPCYAKEKRHPSKLGYVRYADDFVSLVQGKKQEAEDLKNEIREELQWMGLTLSEQKTKGTHWRHVVQFLGYQIQGKPRKKGVGIQAHLKVPRKKLRAIKEAIKQIGEYHQIPEADIIVQMSVMSRGRCNYYRYANAPQAVFSNLASHVWWQYAHYLARKQRSSIAKMIRRERLAKRLQGQSKGRRPRDTDSTKIGEKTLILDIFPPDTGQVRTIPNKGNWMVDLKPVIPGTWQSGRSLATRLAALDRAKGVCERCQEKPATDGHHTIRLRGKTCLARIKSDTAPRYTAMALCKECHVDVHGGSFNPSKQRSSRKAGYAERCLSGLGSAS